MNLIKYLLLLLISFSLYVNNIFANINLTVSPIKYEIETTTGSTITKTATLYNRSDKTHTIITGKSNFISTDNTGNPHFVRQNESVFPDQELASWITIDTDSFIIEPGEKKEITFTINVPDNATPGGHYGAVFFKNNNSEQSSGAQININVDYGVLILVKIDGEIITKADIEETEIIETSSSGGGRGISGKNIVREKDDCSIDLTSSKYDGKCIDDFLNFNDKEEIKKDIENLDVDNESELDIGDFNINFETLFKNEGNTHLKPQGKIKLVDSNGKEIKGIGKEVIKNNAGAIIGEKIVDYLPLNDNGGNVLPGSSRNFEVEWKGFPYESYDETGKKIIKYWTPEEYYSQKNLLEKQFIFPWERINERIKHEKINANIDISYIDKDGKEVNFNSAKEFYVDYKEKYIGLNPYVFIGIFLFLLIIYILWLIFRKKKIKCINKKCNKILEEDMKICPYCGKKQNDKRFKEKNKK